MINRWKIEQKREIGTGCYVYNDIEVILASDYDQLRGTLSLAEEGLANYEQSNETLSQQRDHWLAVARHKDTQIERLRTLVTQIETLAAGNVTGCGTCVTIINTIRAGEP